MNKLFLLLILSTVSINAYSFKCHKYIAPNNEALNVDIQDPNLYSVTAPLNLDSLELKSISLTINVNEAEFNIDLKLESLEDSVTASFYAKLDHTSSIMILARYSNDLCGPRLEYIKYGDPAYNKSLNTEASKAGSG